MVPRPNLGGNSIFHPPPRSTPRPRHTPLRPHISFDKMHFTSMQTSTRNPPIPPRVRFQVVLGHSSKFWQISAGIGFGLLLKINKIKTVKVQTTPFWTLLKDLISDSQTYSFLSFFHSQIPHSLPSCSVCSLLSDVLSQSLDSLILICL